MAREKRRRKSARNFEEEFNEAENDNLYEDDFEEEDDLSYMDDDEDFVEYKPRQKRQQPKEPPKEESKKGRRKSKGKGKDKGLTEKNTKTLIIGLLIGLAIIVVLVLMTLFGGKEPKEEDLPTIGGTPPEEEMVSGNDKKEDSSLPSLSESSSLDKKEETPTVQKPSSPTASMEDQPNTVNPGLPDPNKGKQNVNTGTLEDPQEFLMDINGNEIPQNYQVKKIVSETDFVSYVKKRGLTADGVELLWLDAEYKGLPYSVQVPFKIWKELDPQGITVVDMEVLYLDGDAKVISYMKVKENYKEIMEKGEQAVNKKTHN